MTGYLEIATGGDRRVVALRDDVMHVGRGLSADVRIDDATVSRKHAVIVRRDDGVVILDDRSMNGVWVDGERVTEALRSRANPVLELEDVLRDALADLLAEQAQYGPVVDERGVVCGVLSIELLSHALREDPQAVPSGADAP